MESEEIKKQLDEIKIGLSNVENEVKQMTINNRIERAESDFDNKKWIAILFFTGILGNIVANSIVTSLDFVRLIIAGVPVALVGVFVIVNEINSRNTLRKIKAGNEAKI